MYSFFDVSSTQVAAKDLMNSGDRIVLPVSIQKVPSAKTDSTFSEEEMKFLHSMVLFKVCPLRMILLLSPVWI